MTDVCIEEKTMNTHTREGLRILARIIARDFTKNQPLDGDYKKWMYKRQTPTGRATFIYQRFLKPKA